MRLKWKFEWRWGVVCKQTQAFAYSSCEWQYIDSCNHLEHSSKQPQRSIFDRCTFKSKPSHCNLPLLERCSCDGELLPFTTQNFNSFLTSCKYFGGTHFVLHLKLLSIWRYYCVAHVFIQYVHTGNHEQLCSSCYCHEHDVLSFLFYRCSSNHKTSTTTY